MQSFSIFWFFYAIKLLPFLYVWCYRKQYGQNETYPKLYRYLKKTLFFQEFFLIILEGYLMVLISTYLQFDSTYTFKDLEHEKYSTIFATVMIIFSLVVTPIAFIYLVT